MALDKEAAELALNAPPSGYVKLKELAPGASIKLHVVNITQQKVKDTRYAVKVKGVSTDWCYRFTIDDGKVLDTSTKAIYSVIVKKCYDAETGVITPKSFEIYVKNGPLGPKESKYGVKDVN